MKKSAFTMADRLSRLHTPSCKSAFTMAEILISLTIIGIIAAITLPALQSNINEKTWNTQRKAFYSRMTQAISMMPSLNGYGVTSDPSETRHNATQAFIAELGKTLKINNVCDNMHLLDCGISQDEGRNFIVNNLSGTQVSMHSLQLSDLFAENAINSNPTGTDNNDYNIDVGGFETANGEHVLVYYNPYCVGNSHNENLYAENYMYNKVCAHFVYDLNGAKGPNTVGKDVGLVAALYSSDSVVVAPMPLANVEAKAEFADASTICREQDEDSRLPNLEEAIAMRMNVMIFSDEFRNIAAWTNQSVKYDTAWLYHADGIYWPERKNYEGGVEVWCVKR